MVSKSYAVIINPRVRLVLSVGVGLLAYLVLPEGTKSEIRLLLAWDLGVLFLLAIVLMMMKKADAEYTMHRAQVQEPSNIATLTLTVLISGASMVAVAFMLNDGAKWKADPANFHLGLCAVAIFSAWLLLHTFFAIHYAQLYYDEMDDGQRGIIKKVWNFRVISSWTTGTSCTTPLPLQCVTKLLMSPYPAPPCAD